MREFVTSPSIELADRMEPAKQAILDHIAEHYRPMLAKARDPRQQSEIYQQYLREREALTRLLVDAIVDLSALTPCAFLVVEK